MGEIDIHTYETNAHMEINKWYLLSVKLIVT